MTASFPHLTKRNLVVIGCCLALTLAIILLGPVLQVQQKLTLDQQIADSQKRIQVLKRAVQLQQQLLERNAGLQTITGSLPVAAGSLPSDQSDQVLAELRQLAEQSNVNLVDVKPNLKSMGQSSKSMQIAATVHGSMTGFQDMLNSLLQTPYVERIQRLLISSEPEGLQLKTHFTVHIK